MWSVDPELPSLDGRGWGRVNSRKNKSTEGKGLNKRDLEDEGPQELGERPWLEPHKFAQFQRREMTDAERALWSRLSGRKLDGFKFRNQQPIGEYTVDFYSAELRLIIEVDGDSHENKAEADAVRDAWLRKQGHEVLRFSNWDVLEKIDEVVAKIRNVCGSRGHYHF